MIQSPHAMNTSLLAGTLFTPTQRLENTWIEIQDGKIASLSECEPGTTPSHDFSDAVVIPGLVDLQVNGALGYSFQSQHQEYFDKIVRYHRTAGTTTLLPTLVTAPEPVLLESLSVLARYISPQHACLPGIHLEGPFLSPEKSGAHDPAALRLPDPDLAERLVAVAGGAVRILTLAPELPGALALIRAVTRLGVIASAGHTAATYEQLQEALHTGLSLVTHAGNASDWPHRAMGRLGFLSSEPGLVGTLMASAELAGGVIMDGFHFHPALLAPLLQLKGPNRLVLVSDASTIAGCPPGEYDSGGLVVTVHPEGFATSGRGGGWLAGSTITLLDAVRRAIHLAGIPFQQAVHMASLGPARLLGIETHSGHLEPGAIANLVVLNKDFSLRAVFYEGRELVSGAE
jgi:N-acetylglucosamine-6-phosphate deacetylase